MITNRHSAYNWLGDDVLSTHPDEKPLVRVSSNEHLYNGMLMIHESSREFIRIDFHLLIIIIVIITNRKGFKLNQDMKVDKISKDQKNIVTFENTDYTCDIPVESHP